MPTLEKENPRSQPGDYIVKVEGKTNKIKYTAEIDQVSERYIFSYGWRDLVTEWHEFKCKHTLLYICSSIKN